MSSASPDALAARSQLAAAGWIARRAESFRHLPPPGPQVWLGDAAGPAPGPADALEDGWTLQPIGPTLRGRIDARWLDLRDPAQRAELLASLPAPGQDEAAPFAWAHRALCTQGLRLRIAAAPDEAPCNAAQATVWLQLDLPARQAVSAPLLVIEVQAGVRCVLLETHCRASGSSPPAVTQNLQVHVQLGQGAALHHVRVVQPGAADRLAHHVHVRLAADARYRQAMLGDGAAYHLQRGRIDLEGPGAHATSAAVLFNRAQVLDHQLRVRHGLARTHSDCEVLALAAGRAQLVANAYTHIASGAHEAVARQRLCAIPTEGDPRIVLRPHLQIEHDQVQAAHGATVGALDENALFYASQRGIALPDARALLLHGRSHALLARALGEASDGLLEALGIEATLARSVARHLSGDARTGAGADHG